jgi:alpha-N-acetylglucosamine transferase
MGADQHQQHHEHHTQYIAPVLELEPAAPIVYPDLVRKSAYVTYISNDAWGKAAAVLGYSIMRTNTSAIRLCMIGKDVSESLRINLRKIWSEVREVPDFSIPASDQFKRLRGSANMLHVWSLKEFAKVIFIDPDAIMLHNMDHLFPTPGLAASRECFFRGPTFGEDTFNAGIMVLTPDLQKLQLMKDILADPDIISRLQISFDAAQQHLINTVFRDEWFRMPPRYSFLPVCCMRSATGYPCLADEEKMANHSILDGLKRVSILHFSRMQKPWSKCNKPGYREGKYTDGKLPCLYSHHDACA